MRNGNGGMKLTVPVLIAIISAVGLIGTFAFNFAHSFSDADHKLDRNLVEIQKLCVALKQVDADLRIHLLQTEAREHGLQPIAVDC